MRQKLKYLNYKVLVPYLVLMIIGIVMVYSASSDILLVNGFNPFFYGQRQLIYDCVAFICFGIPFFWAKLNVFKNNKFVIGFLLLSDAMLAYLVVLKIFRGSAAAVNGAVGWIKIGSLVNIQPLEIAKLALVIFLANVFNKRDGKLIPGNLVRLLKYPALNTFIMISLVIVEPDFGGAAILFMIVIVMFSVSGINKRLAFWTLGIVFLGVIGVVLLILMTNPKFLQSSYQFQRLLAFAHPFKLEKTGGAQLVNSYYAIHNGGIFGVGLGNSMQKRGYLPEPYTDFILSIICEELGALGAILVLGLLFYLMWNIMDIGVKAASQFDTLICYGVATIIFTETVFNVGAVLGLLPITGVTLPFISFGGSSIIVLSAGIGLVLNIYANEQIQEERALNVR